MSIDFGSGTVLDRITEENEVSTGLPKRRRTFVKNLSISLLPEDISPLLPSQTSTRRNTHRRARSSGSIDWRRNSADISPSLLNSVFSSSSSSLNTRIEAYTVGVRKKHDDYKQPRQVGYKTIGLVITVGLVTFIIILRALTIPSSNPLPATAVASTKFKNPDSNDVPSPARFVSRVAETYKGSHAVPSAGQSSERPAVDETMEEEIPFRVPDHHGIPSPKPDFGLPEHLANEYQPAEVVKPLHDAVPAIKADENDAKMLLLLKETPPPPSSYRIPTTPPPTTNDAPHPFFQSSSPQKHLTGEHTNTPPLEEYRLASPPSSSSSIGDEFAQDPRSHTPTLRDLFENPGNAPGHPFFNSAPTRRKDWSNVAAPPLDGYRIPAILNDEHLPEVCGDAIDVALDSMASSADRMLDAARKRAELEAAEEMRLFRERTEIEARERVKIALAKGPKPKLVRTSAEATKIDDESEERELRQAKEEVVRLRAEQDAWEAARRVKAEQQTRKANRSPVENLHLSSQGTDGSEEEQEEGEDAAAVEADALVARAREERLAHTLSKIQHLESRYLFDSQDPSPIAKSPSAENEAQRLHHEMVMAHEAERLRVNDERIQYLAEKQRRNRDKRTKILADMKKKKYVRR